MLCAFKFLKTIIEWAIAQLNYNDERKSKFSGKEKRIIFSGKLKTNLLLCHKNHEYIVSCIYFCFTIPLKKKCFTLLYFCEI